MISIIIPIYNAERYLKECLESIRRQTYLNYEVLLIDDGSTDGSSRICNEFATNNPHFHYFHRGKEGVSSARNYGLDKAKGEWICFIDADDWVSTDYLQILSSQQPQADITFFGANVMRPDGKRETLVHSCIYADDREGIEEVIYTLKCGQLGDVFGWTWDKMFRTDIIQKHNVRFPENIGFREDEIFTLEYCRYITSIRIIDQAPYYYRVTTDGLTGKGIQTSDLFPSSIRLEESLDYYSNPKLKEHILKSATDYRAMNIYASPIEQIKTNLDEFQNFIRRNPQPGQHCKVNHLTQYLNRSYWLGYIYCIIRKL